MKNGTGLNKETAAALATLLGPTIVVPILFLLIEKDEYVKFWAMQSVVSMVTFVIVFRLLGILANISILGSLINMINGILWLAGFVLWLVYVYKSWQGERWEAPYVGKVSINLLKRAR